MNYHNNEWILARLEEHYLDCKIFFPDNKIIGVFYHGSANYGIDCKSSDVDSFCLLSSNVELEVITRTNSEKIFCFGISYWLERLRKHKDLLMFLVPLFTPYYIVNPLWESAWEEFRESRELLADYNKANIIKDIKIKSRKDHRRVFDELLATHIYNIARYGYDTKMLTLMRLYEYYLDRLLANEPFWEVWQDEECATELLNIKLGKYSPREARKFNADIYNRIKAKLPVNIPDLYSSEADVEMVYLEKLIIEEDKKHGQERDSN